MAPVQNDTAGKSLHQNVVVQGIVWFITIFMVSSLVGNTSISSSVAVAGISAIFYVVFIYFLDPY